jgi:F0F1-type ATP synthase delta subunit
VDDTPPSGDNEELKDDGHHIDQFKSTKGRKAVGQEIIKSSSERAPKAVHARTVFRMFAKIVKKLKNHPRLKSIFESSLSKEELDEVMNFIAKKVCVFRYKAHPTEGEKIDYEPRAATDDDKKKSLLSRLCYSFNHESLAQFLTIPSLNKAFYLARDDIVSELTSHFAHNDETICAVRSLSNLSVEYKQRFRF